MTVHIVEDDPGVRDALAELCRSVGRKVRMYPDLGSFDAGRGVERSDIVLVDLGLPDGHGSDVIRRVRGMPAPPRIVVISGLPLAEIRTALKAFPDIPIMRKPLMPDLIGLLCDPRMRPDAKVPGLAPPRLGRAPASHAAVEAACGASLRTIRRTSSRKTRATHARARIPVPKRKLTPPPAVNLALFRMVRIGRPRSGMTGARRCGR